MAAGSHPETIPEYFEDGKDASEKEKELRRELEAEAEGRGRFWRVILDAARLPPNADTALPAMTAQVGKDSVAV